MGCPMFICLAILPSDPLGQTVDNAIVMFKNKSRVAPCVTSITTVPLGRCPTVVVVKTGEKWKIYKKGN